MIRFMIQPKHSPSDYSVNNTYLEYYDKPTLASNKQKITNIIFIAFITSPLQQNLIYSKLKNVKNLYLLTFITNPLIHCGPMQGDSFSLKNFLPPTPFYLKNQVLKT